MATVSSQRRQPNLLSGAQSRFEDHRPYQGLGIEPSVSRTKRPPQGTVATKVFPQLMRSKDIAKAPARLLNDVGVCVLSAPERSIEPIDPADPE